MTCPKCGDNPCSCYDDANDGPCPEGKHVWTGQHAGGSPSEPDDWICYCSVCGIEHPGSGEFPAVVINNNPERPELPPYEG